MLLVPRQVNKWSWFWSKPFDARIHSVFCDWTRAWNTDIKVSRFTTIQLNVSVTLSLTSYWIRSLINLSVLVCRIDNVSTYPTRNNYSIRKHEPQCKIFVSWFDHRCSFCLAGTVVAIAIFIVTLAILFILVLIYRYDIDFRFRTMYDIMSASR